MCGEATLRNLSISDKLSRVLRFNSKKLFLRISLSKSNSDNYTAFLVKLNNASDLIFFFPKKYVSCFLFIFNMLFIYFK